MLDRSPRLTLAANLTLESYVGVLRDLYDHSLMETVTGTYGVPYSSFSSRVSPSVNTLERVELEVVLLIEPAALEELQRQSGSSGKSEGVDRQLHVRVLFLSCIRLVIQDVDIAVADLQEVDVAGDHGAVEFKVKTPSAVVADVVPREMDRNFHRDRDRIVDEHETLQRLVTLLVVW